MNELLLRSWWMLALRGAAALLFGILALTWPAITLFVMFAAFALISGAAYIIGALRRRGRERGWWLMLLLGLVSISAGIVAIVDPRITVFVLVLLMGVNALITGILDIVMAVRLSDGDGREWLLGLTGVISIVFGLVVFLYPPAGALALAFIVGLYATFVGFLLLILAFRVWQLTKRSGALGDAANPLPRRAST
jgi:uncharacterized membrane protein HdeD (DUF308 family)